MKLLLILDDWYANLKKLIKKKNKTIANYE